MAAEEAWTIELVQDRGHRGAREPGFLRGPRFLVRRPGAVDAEGLVELKLGDVYVAGIREAARPDSDDEAVLDLLDEVGPDLVRRDVSDLVLETPPRVTPLYVDGEGVALLIERAARRG